MLVGDGGQNAFDTIYRKFHTSLSPPKNSQTNVFILSIEGSWLDFVDRFPLLPWFSSSLGNAYE